MTIIYVSDPVHADVLAELRQLGEVHLGYGPTAVAYQQVRDIVDAVMLRSETFDRDKIADSPRLRIIARHGIGYDNVDVDAATDAGVWVTVTPGRNSRAVAEHVFALALALARKIPTAAGRTRDGFWSQNKAELTGFELHGRTLGLLGLGSIGSMVLQIARGFGMQVLVTDPVLDADAGRRPRCPQGRVRRAARRLGRAQPARPADRLDPAHHRRGGTGPAASGCRTDQHLARWAGRRAGAGRGPALAAGCAARRSTCSRPRPST